MISLRLGRHQHKLKQQVAEKPLPQTTQGQAQQTVQKQPRARPIGQALNHNLPLALPMPAQKQNVPRVPHQEDQPRPKKLPYSMQNSRPQLQYSIKLSAALKISSAMRHVRNPLPQISRSSPQLKPATNPTAPCLAGAQKVALAERPVQVVG
jgi:hypothetical protein